MSVKKKDLEIFRGTYQECMAHETSDMTIYLAWDTGEIFVGNALGKKIPYGNNKVLQKELFDKIKELKAQIPSLIENQIEDGIYINSGLAKIENKLKQSIYDEIDIRITATLGRVFSSLTEMSRIINEHKKEFNSSKTESLKSHKKYESQLLALRNNLELGLSHLEGLIREMNLDFSPRIEELEQGLQNTITYIDNKVIALADPEGVTAELVNSIINPQITNLTSILNSRINNIDNRKLLRYMSGNDIKADILALGTNISQFVPTFCLMNDSQNEYLAGSIYYYDSSSQGIAEAAGGGGATIEKNILDAGLHISSSPADDDYEISSNNILLNLNLSVDNKEYARNYRLNGNNIEFDSDSSALSITNVSINRSSPKTVSYIFSATPIEETRRTKYTAESASKTIYVYIPSWYGKGQFNSATFTKVRTLEKGHPYVFSNLSANDTISFYSDEQITNGFILSSALELPINFTESRETQNVNGINYTYYKYSYTIASLPSGQSSITIKIN